MSVALYCDGELRSVFEALVQGGITPRDAGNCLMALGIANRAAHMMQYSDVAEIKRPDLDADPTPCPVQHWTLEDWVGNLLYNCVTNAGTDFAPINFADQLRVWARRLTALQDLQREVN